MITSKTWTNGAKNGLQISLALLKVIIPCYIAVKILGYTPVIGWAAQVFAPLMSLVGLPGETAIAFFTGALLSIYASAGIIVALDLSPWEITTIAVMINLSHELIVETAILKKTGIRNVWIIVIIRFGAAWLAGALMNIE
jgi:spore maturation protein SpmB